MPLDAERKTEYIILDDFNIYYYAGMHLNLQKYINLINGFMVFGILNVYDGRFDRKIL